MQTDLRGCLVLELSNRARGCKGKLAVYDDIKVWRVIRDNVIFQNALVSHIGKFMSMSDDCFCITEWFIFVCSCNDANLIQLYEYSFRGRVDVSGACSSSGDQLTGHQEWYLTTYSILNNMRVCIYISILNFRDFRDF